MNQRPIHLPTDAYPITVTPTGRRVTVRIDGEIVADSTDALTLQESNHPAGIESPCGAIYSAG